MIDSILKSRRFWLLVLDTVFTLTVYFVGKYAGGTSEDIRITMAALQPIFISLIICYTVDDTQMIKAGIHPRQVNLIKDK